MRQLGTVLFAAAAAASLSDLGSVTGFYVDAAGVGFGFLRYLDGTIAVFGVPDSVFLEAVGTNDAGKRALRVSDYVQDNSVSLVVRGEATASASTYSGAVPTGNGGWPLTDGVRTFHSRINNPVPFHSDYNTLGPANGAPDPIHARAAGRQPPPLPYLPRTTIRRLQPRG